MEEMSFNNGDGDYIKLPPYGSGSQESSQKLDRKRSREPLEELEHKIRMIKNVCKIQGEHFTSFTHLFHVLQFRSRSKSIQRWMNITGTSLLIYLT